MNILQRLPRTTLHISRYRVINSNETTRAYSICLSHRNERYEGRYPPPICRSTLSPTSICFVPKRHKSFSEIFSQIYTNVSHSTAVSYFQNGLISFQDFTGLPWWATVIIYTFGLRLAVFPLAVYGQKIKARLHSIIYNEMPAMNDELKREVAIAKKQFNLSDRDAFRLYKISFNKQYRLLIERDNCHPFKTTIMVWFQIPIWICHSIGIRNILTMQPDPSSPRALMLLRQLAMGGCLWIPNLMQPDGCLILPVVWCITNLINIELGVLEKGGPSTKFTTVFTNIFRGVIIAIVPVAASLPSCLTLYWCTSSACALAQNLILLSPKAKRTLGIPLNTQYHMDHPYRTIAQRFVEQMEKRKNWCVSLVKPK